MDTPVHITPVMYLDPSGFDAKTWLCVASVAMMVGGIVLMATGVGGVAGSLLLAAGAGSLLGGFTNEELGGSFIGGWVGGGIVGTAVALGGAVGSGLLFSAAETTGYAALGFSMASLPCAFLIGAAGGGLGSFLSQAIDKGTKGVDWEEVAFRSAYSGFLGIVASLIPSTSLIQSVGQSHAIAWGTAFAIGGEIVFDCVSIFVDRWEEIRKILPNPIFC
jgi:hypothetical protein